MHFMQPGGESGWCIAGVTFLLSATSARDEIFVSEVRMKAYTLVKYNKRSNYLRNFFSKDNQVHGLNVLPNLVIFMLPWYF